MKILLSSYIHIVINNAKLVLRLRHRNGLHRGYATQCSPIPHLFGDESFQLSILFTGPLLSLKHPRLGSFPMRDKDSSLIRRQVAFDNKRCQIMQELV